MGGGGGGADHLRAPNSAGLSWGLGGPAPGQLGSAKASCWHHVYRLLASRLRGPRLRRRAGPSPGTAMFHSCTPPSPPTPQPARAWPREGQARGCWWHS